MAISRNELSRIISSVHGQANASSDDLPRREKLKQLSNARVAGWNDTLQAAHKAKLNWKSEKLRREEEERIAQDTEFAAQREVTRMDTLEKADRLLQEQTERIRQFRSQQMLVDTLHTRDEQLKELEERKRRETLDENLWHAAVVKNIQKDTLESKNEVEKGKKRSMELALNLRRQRDEQVERIRARQQEKRDEEAALIQTISMDELAAEKVRIGCLSLK